MKNQTRFVEARQIRNPINLQDGLPNYQFFYIDNNIAVSGTEGIMPYQFIRKAEAKKAAKISNGERFIQDSHDARVYV